MELAAARNIPVIEDCAQAFLAAGRRPAGRHASARSAASACSRASTSPPARAAWSSPTTTRSRAGCPCSSTRRGATAIPNPDHYFLALNYRMSELQGAVARAQLDKLEGGRRAPARDGRAARPSSSRALPGIATAAGRRRARTHLLEVLPARGSTAMIAGGAPALGAALKETGIASAPALHPEAGVSVRGLPGTADVRQQPLPVHAGAAGGGRLRPRALPRHLRRRSSGILVLPWNEALHRRARRLHRGRVRMRRAALEGGTRS